jgi:hypothetical protein
MRILDCTNPEVTFCSVCNVLDVHRDRLNSIFAEFPPEYTEHVSVAEETYRQLGILIQQITFDGVYYFHLTRALNPDRFTKGLLPLSQVLDQIWTDLFGLVKDEVTTEDWQEFRRFVETDRSNQFADKYRLKVAVHLNEGPFGILIRETAFHPLACGNHDYFGTPEIVEHICDCHGSIHNADLQARFLRASKPCIVKYKVYNEPPHAVGVALQYLYNNFYGLGMDMSLTYGHDAKGQAVPPDLIEDIETVESYRSIYEVE